MDENGTGLAGGDEWGENAPKKERTCLICGCTDSKACEGGCAWVLPEVCSKCITERVPECIFLLIEVILETHQAEIDAKHHGDDTCSTCDLIKFARQIETGLRQ